MSLPKPAQMTKRSLLSVAATIGIGLLFIARLFYLQVLSPSYKERAESNAFYAKAVYPPRGVIYDRNGQLLVFNKPTYDLMVVSREVVQLDTLGICRALSIDPTYLAKRFADIRNRRLNPGYSPFVPQVLISQIDEVEAGRFREQLYKFPGFFIRSRTIRQYQYAYGAHILGYLSEASPGDLASDSSLVAGDYVGKSGVERSYETFLRGEKGVEVLLRDARGRIKGRYKEGSQDRQPLAGRDIYLSIDKDLQAFGEELMRGKRGAIVAIQPSSGEVLCLVSSPSYDPNLLTGRDKGRNHYDLEHEPGNPLYTRAIMGTYPPGSTFKPSQGAIFLQEGVITPATNFTCYHGYPLLRNKPACHSHASPLPLVPALATSCNAFFCWGLHYMLDDRKRYPNVQTAFSHWKNYMVEMGYGYKLGIDLPGERRGYIPNSKVYDKVYKKRWNSSTVISIAIGQGEVLATPLQMANLAAIVANRGYYYSPHVVRRVDGIPLDTAYSRRRFSGISAVHWEQIAQGMARAVTGGTCHAANFAPGEIVVCGKTGTAENPHGKDHSAFIGFAPMYNPDIAVAVYVENGGFGAVYGVPIGRLIMEYYLRKGELSAAALALSERMKETSVYYPDMIYLPRRDLVTVPRQEKKEESQDPPAPIVPNEPAKALKPEEEISSHNVHERIGKPEPL